MVSLEEAGHPLAKAARQEVDLIENAPVPDTTRGYTQLELDATVQLVGGVTVRFGKDGSIMQLDRRGVEWASESKRLGAFTYKTLNDSDWMPFTYSYLKNNAPSPGFWKPGSNEWSESTIFRPTATALHVNAAKTSVVVQMEMPARSTEKYGSWKIVHLELSVDTAKPSELDLTYTTLSKGIASIGESTSITFQPAPQLKSPTRDASAWSIDKLGHSIDPEGVVDGGNQFNHASWGGTKVNTVAGSMTIRSLDAPNVNPMTEMFPIGNPLPASIDQELSKSGKGMSQLTKGSVIGMATNLHNNLWNTSELVGLVTLCEIA